MILKNRSAKLKVNSDSKAKINEKKVYRRENGAGAEIRTRVAGSTVP